MILAFVANCLIGATLVILISTTVTDYNEDLALFFIFVTFLVFIVGGAVILS